MKLIHMLSVGVATVGMTCLVGYASAANTAPGGLTTDSMLVAQSTSAPGGRGGGDAAETGRADKGSMSQKGKDNPGMGADKTIPAKKPGMENTQPGEDTGSNSGKTEKRSGPSTEPTGDAGLSGMKGTGSGSSSGTGGGGK
ncbi:MAG: hypothetical protein ABI684_08455 [Nitrospirota bacterium]